MPIPTESIGSIPRSRELLTAMGDHAAGRITDAQLEAAQHEALKDTIARLEETGSPVLTDGEQMKPSFATYPLAGLHKLAFDGVTIPFADGHTRQPPRLSGWSVCLWRACSRLFGGGAEVHEASGEAGCDFGLGAEPVVSRAGPA